LVKKIFEAAERDSEGDLTGTAKRSGDTALNGLLDLFGEAASTCTLRVTTPACAVLSEGRLVNFN
jgi:hypothetical protein